MSYIELYYKKIVNNEVIVSNKIRKIYKHLVDNIENPSGAYFFNEAKADHAINFIESYCKHSKGKVGGKPFILELWQKALVSATFGFVDKDGLRQYRELILIVARKNGKSALGSALALYMLFADDEAGAEIYSAATRKDQAKIIWNEAVKMIKKSPALKRRSKCLVSEIKSFMNEGSFRPLSSDSNSLDGLNVHAALLDEIHAWKTTDLYDVIVDGKTARDQPLTIITSTAGTVRESIYDQKYEQCTDIINGYEDPNGYKNERVLPIIYELDTLKEWTNPTAWGKANPGLGSIKSLQQLAEKVEAAKHNSRLVPNLLCKDFNLRQNSSQAYLTFEQIDNQATFNFNDFAPKPSYCIGGFDLSQTTDLTCATILFKLAPDDPMFYCHQMYWIPEDLFEKRKHEDHAPYDIWFQRDLLRTSAGNINDFHLITEWFLEIQEKYDLYLYKCGYDAWGAQYLSKEMADTFGETTMDRVIQGKQTLSVPMQNLAAHLEAKHINYNNNPILKWCMGNVAVDIDRNGNIQPKKQINQRLRIDGFASLLDAYTSYERNMDDYLNMI